MITILLDRISWLLIVCIGNKNTILKRTTLPIIKGIVTLPCDVSIIEAVTYCGEDFNYTSNLTYDGSKETEDFIES